MCRKIKEFSEFTLWGSGFRLSCRVTGVPFKPLCLLLIALVSAGIWNSHGACADGSISFNRDVRPILAETCFHCHGPDEEGREADLRLDIESKASEDRGGYQAISPGDLKGSEAWSRIMSDDDDMLMPPPESHLSLNKKQKAVLKQWIIEGAQYEGHWAFAPPHAPDVPHVQGESSRYASWIRNEIDSFVLAELVKAGASPSAEADPRTLIRRLTFDLTGLPPTLEETRHFVRNYQTHGERAYQEAIQRLIHSPHFGERMTVPWLDQARYADTNGYSIDGGRDMWLWRDWVIQAYNDNMPFDQFLREQLAGDLLPNATEAQLIATGFNRNHMITHEGGTIPEENLTNYVADRVKTTSEVFLGLTFGCAQCHDHKYDPISQKEYYEFFAFFNELDDRGLDGNAGKNAMPQMSASTVMNRDELKGVNAELEAARTELSNTTNGFDEWVAEERSQEKLRGDGFHYVDAELLDASAPNRPGPYEFDSDGTVSLSAPSKGLAGFSHSIQLRQGAQQASETISGVSIEFYPQQVSDSAGDDAEESTEPLLSLTPFPDGVPKITAVLVSANNQPADQVDYHGQCKLISATATTSTDGHAASSVLDERNVHWWQPIEKNKKQILTLTFAEPVDPTETPFLSVLVFFGKNQSLPFRWRVRPFTGHDPQSKWNDMIAAALMEDQSLWSKSTRQQLLSIFRQSAPSLRSLRTQISNLEGRKNILTNKHSTMVMNTSSKPRETFVLTRGQYDAPTLRVTPRTPKILPPLRRRGDGARADGKKNGKDTQLTRLDLANWLTDSNHPLTARVAVNRIWALFFGTGIVSTSADFGSQGEYPSHPDLLDYLATRFVSHGWDQKELIQMIVSSATYRQQSVATDEQLAVDPGNRLLGRGPRFRLPAEFIRDQALAVSGLLVPRVGGPSVHPYQPHGLWKEISHFGSTPATKQVFVQDHGEKLYRRSLYTIVKRTSPHPAMAAFDAPNREMCVVDRSQTNTPLQALVTLNDPQFAEAARVFASSILRDQTANDDRSRIKRAFERITSRQPESSELEMIAQLLDAERARFEKSPIDAERVVAVGEYPVAHDLDPIEQAAWTQVAVLLINLSEVLTRQ